MIAHIIRQAVCSARRKRRRTGYGHPTALILWVLAHDHLKGRTWLFADGGPDGDLRLARGRLAWIKAKVSRLSANCPVEPSAIGQSTTCALPLSQPYRSIGRTATLAKSLTLPAAAEVAATRERIAQALPLHANFTRDEYLRAVDEVKDYIAAGDTYEVNLSQRFDAPLPGDPWTLYTLLRKINPAPFAAYLKYPELTVLSASPEQFLRLENGLVETRPIKGTRPRGATPQLDRELARELIESEKERAENVWLLLPPAPTRA